MTILSLAYLIKSCLFTLQTYMHQITTAIFNNFGFQKIKSNIRNASDFHCNQPRCNVSTTNFFNVVPNIFTSSLENTVSRRSQNFEPSHEICHFPRNFDISVEFYGIL